MLQFWSSRLNVLRPITKTALVVALLLGGLPFSLRAQEAKDTWQRIYTGEDSVIEVNPLSLRFDEGHILRAEFRTSLAKAESLKGKPETKYQRRLETIEFNLTARTYRFSKIALLDSAGATILSDEGSASEWKPLKPGGMMERLFDAVRRLPPLGEWKVVDYRLGDGPSSDTQDFKKFIGTKVWLTSDRADVGQKTCSLPAYQSKLLTDKEFLGMLGVSIEAVGLKTHQAETIVVKCEGSGWDPSQSLLVKVPEGGMLMLWEGVFLVLKRQR